MIPVLTDREQVVANWLLILSKPGDYMVFNPVEFGVKGETIQAYVHKINKVTGSRYKVRNGVRKQSNYSTHRAYRPAKDPVLVYYSEMKQ